MSKRLLLPLFLLPLAVCSQSKEADAGKKKAGRPVVITGKVSGMDTGWVYLQGASGDRRRTDSVRLKKGAFKFKGSLEEPAPCTFATGNRSSGARSFYFFGAPGKIRIEAEKGHEDSARVSGPAETMDFAELSSLQKPYGVLQREVYQEEVKAKGDQHKIDSLEVIYDKIGEAKRAATAAFVHAHPSSIVSAYALRYDFMYPPGVNQLEELYNLLDESVRATSYGKPLKEKIAVEKLVGVGKPAPEFTQNDTLDRPVSLKDFRGKYVLLDFWASWCGPCRKENPNVVEAWQLYKDKNFTVLGVSFDNPGMKEKWMNAIHKDNLTWTQVSDLKGWENAAGKMYGINGIPANFLLDPNGVIVARDLHGAALKKKLAELLGEVVPAGVAAARARQQQIDSLKQVIEAGGDNLKALQKYVSVLGATNDTVSRQFASWMQQYPDAVNYQLALGEGLYELENPKARPYLLKVAAMQPKNAEIWQMLSVDAERWGDNAAAREYKKKATEAAPTDPNYAFYYAMSFEEVDKAKWEAALYELAKRFPASERGAQGLYWLAFRSTDPAKKVRVFEKCRALYAPDKFRWSSSAMYGLYDEYIQQDQLVKAKSLAVAMGSSDGWPEKAKLAENVATVKQLIGVKKYTEALEVVGKIKLPRYNSISDEVALLWARVKDASGDQQGAYDSLVRVYAKAPADNVRQAIGRYGKKLGKADAQVDADIWAVRDRASKPAADFRLGLYTSEQSASLADYKGKVTLMTFWFPGCGPCRGEFPHFENVVKKFMGRGLSFVGINVFPEQDEYVMPFMKGTKYSFTPLRGNAKWAQEAYGVRGEPTNFLIDGEGKIIFSNFMINGNNERMLELMISSMLDREQQKRTGAVGNDNLPDELGVVAGEIGQHGPHMEGRVVIDGKAKLHGVLKGFNNQVEVDDLSEYQYLLPKDGSRVIVPDSAGRFSISLKLEKPGYYRLGRNILYLTPGDDLEVFIDKTYCQRGQFKGQGAEANLYLCNTPFPKGGSYLDGGKNVKPAPQATLDVILAAAALRGRQLDSVQGVSAAFRRLEAARIKADVLNSIGSTDGYAPMMLRLKGDSAELYIKQFHAVSDPVREKYRKDFVDASLMQLVVYRDIAQELPGVTNGEGANAVAGGKATGASAKDVQTIRDWYTAYELVEKMQHAHDKQELKALAPQIDALATVGYRDALKKSLADLEKFGKGDPAADFTAVDLNGKAVKLSDLKGKVIYVDIWATWCGPCMAEMPHFEELKAKYKDNKDVAFVSLSIDDTATPWKHSVASRKAEGIQWLINRNALIAYNVVGIPRTLLIAPDFRMADMSAPMPSSPDAGKAIESLLKK